MLNAQVWNMRMDWNNFWIMLKKVPDSNGRFYCPCVNCSNERQLSVTKIREHIFYDGFCKSYTRWTWHGELLDMLNVSDGVEIDLDTEECLEDMICNIGMEAIECGKLYDNLCNDTEKPLYLGSINYTRLSAVLRSLNLKERM